MKKGLVLEGGAMRGLWTAGVTDVMMEHCVWPDGLIGVSAGAAFGCNYKSRQVGRAIRYNTRFAKDARYSGIRSWLTTGDYFNAQFGYHVVPYEYDLFDTKAFEENPMEFVVVCTDVTTGQAVYHTMNHVDYDEPGMAPSIGLHAIGVEGGRSSGTQTAGRRRGRQHSPILLRTARLRQERGHPDTAHGLCEGAQQADAADAHWA